jgi:hypothetical protein
MASCFTSPPKEGVRRIFSALKNQSHLPGLNPRTLEPMTSTLSITPQSGLPRHILILILI